MRKKQRGVITRIDGKRCRIHSQGENHRAYIKYKIKGADPNSSKPLCVGDEVVFQCDKSNEIKIEEVLPRKSKLSRRAIGSASKEQVVVSNVEQLLIVTSVGMPAFHPAIIDRFLVASFQGNLDPIICINKIDLFGEEPNPELVTEVIEIYRNLDYSIILTSTVEKEGLDELKSLLQGRSTVVAGHSGVGKSSLLLSLDPDLKLVTKEVGKKTKRGRHATTSVNLLPLKQGGYVVDTPGIRELSLWETEEREVSLYFPEMLALSSQCKYRGCTHIHEPKCEVKRAVEAGELPLFRYESYLHIMESLQMETMASRPVYRDA